MGMTEPCFAEHDFLLMNPRKSETYTCYRCSNKIKARVFNKDGDYYCESCFDNYLEEYMDELKEECLL